MNTFVSTLQNELTSLKNINRILSRDLEVVKAELAKVVDDVIVLQGDHSGLKTGVTSSKSAVATLQRAMKNNNTNVGVVVVVFLRL